MGVWLTYRLEDLLLFTPQVYDRLFTLHHQALWPAQGLAVVAGLAVLWALLRRLPGGGRLIPLVLGLAWLWVGWSFLWQRYATINWAAVYVAPAFWLEGLALLAFAATRRGLALPAGPPPPWPTALLFGAVLLGYPLLAPLEGRPWTAAELWGMTPDPTAVGTLALAAAAGRRGRWLLLPIPLLWCALSGATLWGLERGDWFVAPAAALLALLLPLLNRHPAKPLSA